MGPKRFCFFAAVLFVGCGVAVAQSGKQYLDTSEQYWYGGNYQASLRYAEKARPLIEKDSGVNSRYYARFADQFMGMIYEKLGDTKEALRWYQLAIDVYRQTGGDNSFDFGEAATNLGNLLNQLSDSNGAEVLLVQAREVLRKAPRNFANAYGGATNNLANTYNYVGKYPEAIALYTEIVDSLQKWRAGQSLPTAILYTNISTAYGKMGKYQKAIQVLRQALPILKKLGKTYWENQATALFNLANIYVFINRFDSSEKYLNEALLQAKEGTKLHAEILSSLGLLQVQKKDFDSAETLYKRALAIASRSKNFLGNTEFSILTNFASLYYVTSRYLQADSLFKLAFQRFFSLRDPDYFLGNTLYETYCSFLINNRRYGEAADTLRSLSSRVLPFIRRNFAGMAEGDKLDFIAKLYRIFDLQYSLLALDKNLPPSYVQHAFSNALLVKSLVLSNQSAVLRTLRANGDSALQARFNKWISLKQLLRNQYLLEPAHRKWNVDSLLNEADLMEVTLNRYAQTKEVLQTYRETPVSEVAGKLRPNERAVEFVRFSPPRFAQASEALYGAFVFGPADTVPQFVVLCSEAKLRELMSNGKGGTSEKIYPTVDEGITNDTKESRQLYGLVWKPLEPLVSGAKKIYYSPAGLLHYVAFNAVSNGHGKVLLDKYRLQPLVSLRNLSAAGPSMALSKASLWGNMNYDEAGASPTNKISKNSVAALKGAAGARWKEITTTEIADVKRILMKKGVRAETMQGAKASEALFKKSADGFDGILHVSTHGFYAPDTFALAKNTYGNAFTGNVNPMLRCGLIFSGGNRAWLGGEALPGTDDGILTGNEISEMDLHNVGLVTLSACETGLGKVADYEGLFGLQRAFKMAGAGKLLLSLWKVPAVKTSQLMQRFYLNWTKGLSPEEALLAAQKSLRKAGDPIGWAGFVLVE